jgi:hypothetical protein
MPDCVNQYLGLVAQSFYPLAFFTPLFVVASQNTSEYGSMNPCDMVAKRV